jgi:hypothetical protein
MQTEPPQKAGAPVKDGTDTEPCPDCGVVQEFDVMLQRYEDSPNVCYPDHECPVCGREFEDPW